MQVKINESGYADELKNLNTVDRNCALLYQMYQVYRKAYCGNKMMYLKPKEFIEKHLLCIIDTTRHPENLSLIHILYVIREKTPLDIPTVYRTISLSEKINKKTKKLKKY